MDDLRLPRVPLERDFWRDRPLADDGLARGVYGALLGDGVELPVGHARRDRPGALGVGRGAVVEAVWPGVHPVDLDRPAPLARGLSGDNLAVEWVGLRERDARGDLDPLRRGGAGGPRGGRERGADECYRDSGLV